MSVIYLRVFAQVNTEEKASKLAARIILILNKYLRAESQKVSKYWKIPEYYEIYIKFTNIHLADYNDVKNILATGWDQLNCYESVWNPSDDNKFIIDEIKWAQLEIEEDTGQP